MSPLPHNIPVDPIGKDDTCVDISGSPSSRWPASRDMDFARRSGAAILLCCGPGQLGDDVPRESYEPMQFGFENAFLIAVGAKAFRSILEVRRGSNPVTL